MDPEAGNRALEPARRAAPQPERRAAPGGRARPALARDHRHGHRAQQEHGLQPGERADGVRAARRARRRAPRHRRPARAWWSTSRATAWSRSGWRSTSTTSASRPPISPAAPATRRWRRPTTAAAASTRSSTALGELTHGALEEVQAQGLRPIGATVALPGLVDIQRGALLIAPNLHWSDVPVVELLRERIDAPDAADRRSTTRPTSPRWPSCGRARPPASATSCTARARSASAAGIVLGGELFRGYRGFGGEFGHTTVELDGLPVRVRLARLPGDARGPGAAARRGRHRRQRRVRLARARASRSPSCVRRAAGRGSRRRWPRWPTAARWLGDRARHRRQPLSARRRSCSAGYFAPMSRVARARDRLRARRRACWAATAPSRPCSPPASGAEAAMRGAAATQLRRVLADPTLVAGALPT